MPAVMPVKVPAKRTPISTPELWNAVILAWEPALRVNPTRAAVNLKLAHMRIECGARLESCWNFNLSNIKKHDADGCNWHEIKCGEEIEENKLEGVRALGPTGSVIVKGRYLRDGKRMVSVTILPPHPWSRFKAFSCLTDGVKAQFAYLTTNKYALKHKVLDALMTGDPAQYVKALEKAVFFTANAGIYLNGKGGKGGVINCLRDVERETATYEWVDVA